MRSLTIAMNEQGLVAIPVKSQRALNLHGGTQFIVTHEEGRLVLQPLLTYSLQDLMGIFASDRDVVAELQEERRDDRW